MKRLLLLFSLCFPFSCQMWAQGLTPSTVRQVFSLDKGDSLEYHEWTDARVCGTICNYYILKVVDSVVHNNIQDTLSIYFQNQIVHYDSATVAINVCGQCREYFTWSDICPLQSSRWILTSLDSDIISYLDTIYQIHTPVDMVYDSIYSNSLVYNDSKQDFYNGSLSFDGTTDIYADSIGISYKAEDVELAENNREQLIYYHKANGKTWGIPYIATGIKDLGAYEISIYPNPVQDKFIIQTGGTQMQFELYDLLSKKLIDVPINDTKTDIDRNKLSSGIYYWQVSNSENIVNAGKLVFE